METDAWTTSWLCPTPMDRQRYGEAYVWLVRARLLSLATLLIVFALSSISWTVAFPPLLVTAMGYALADRVGPTRPRPEYWGFASYCLSVACLAYAIARTGGAHSILASWVIISTPGLLARYSRRGIVLGICLSCVLLTTAFLVGTSGRLTLVEVASPLLLLTVITAMCWAMMGSETAQRKGAIVDQLTGMLNRKSLDDRLHALDHQASLTGVPISVLMCDLDHFKDINDSRGHEFGDAVLKQASYRIRKELRSFDAAYRLGGEEFLVLLPGMNEAEATSVAERLRTAVAFDTLQGQQTTMSVGVAGASGASTPAAELITRADAALYRAKQSGRNRVVTDEPRPERAATSDDGARAPSLSRRGSEAPHPTF
jgi:diguanylate cyclase (GGDEF)-like protein